MLRRPLRPVAAARQEKLAVGFAVEVFAFEQIDAENEHGQQQRSEERKADENAEDGDERMGVGHAFLHDEPHDVIDVGDDERAVERQPDGRSPIPFQSHVERQRQPYECRADDRNDRRQASEDTQKSGLGAPKSR